MKINSQDVDFLPKEVMVKLSQWDPMELLLWEDSSVWLAKTGGLLQQLDLQNRTRQTFISNPKRPDALVASHLRCMVRDRTGVLWLGDAATGLFKFSSTRNRFEVYRHYPFDDNSLSNNYIRVIFENRQGKVWVATSTAGSTALTDSQVV
ncbi:MAG: two-component regulator propeller domain-containing protein [Acidobacteriota bacterium]